jgi:outer membrane autotransporter protein
MAGVMAGYLASNLDFKHSGTGADFESGTVGGYLTYLRGGWFFDSKVVASLGDVDYGGKSSVKDNADVVSIGGVLDTGYRMNYGPTFIEPGATLAYVNTDIDDLSIYGASVDFSRGESLRGRLGLRFGTTIQDEQAKYEPFMGVSAWYEFLGDNGADVTSGSYVLKTADDVSGAIGEVTGGVNIFGVAGDDFSGFIKGNVAFGKDDFVGYGGTVGARVGW